MLRVGEPRPNLTSDWSCQPWPAFPDFNSVAERPRKRKKRRIVETAPPRDPEVVAWAHARGLDLNRLAQRVRSCDPSGLHDELLNSGLLVAPDPAINENFDRMLKALPVAPADWRSFDAEVEARKQRVQRDYPDFEDTWVPGCRSFCVASEERIEAMSPRERVAYEYDLRHSPDWRRRPVWIYLMDMILGIGTLGIWTLVSGMKQHQRHVRIQNLAYRHGLVPNPIDDAVTVSEELEPRNRRRRLETEALLRGAGYIPPRRPATRIDDTGQADLGESYSPGGDQLPRRR